MTAPTTAPLRTIQSPQQRRVAMTEKVNLSKLRELCKAYHSVIHLETEENHPSSASSSAIDLTGSFLLHRNKNSNMNNSDRHLHHLQLARTSSLFLRNNTTNNNNRDVMFDD